MITASQLQDILVAALTRRIGGTQRRWRSAIGPIKVYDPATHAHCNWSIQPSGGAGENAAIERLLDDIRISHPLIVAD